MDLFFIDKEYLSFEEMMRLYPEKYPVKAYQPLLLLKAFGYFADADREEIPEMLRDVSWSEIKEHFLTRQKELTKNILAKNG